jgi:AraC-like DNA-binding protein
VPNPPEPDESDESVVEPGPARTAAPDGTPGGVEQEVDLALGDAPGLVVVTLGPSSGDGPRCTVRIGLDDLAVPLRTVRAVAGRLRTSPLHPLVRNHLAAVAAGGPGLADGAAAAALGTATVDLVRALVLSAAAGELDDARPASTTARVQAYVTAHLRDPDLRPARIAAANAVSVRTLYTIYRALGTSLERSILDQRLRGARADLSTPGRRHHSIAAIARSWGFTDPSTFSQQFRRAFGTTPRRCRAEGAAADDPVA